MAHGPKDIKELCSRHKNYDEDAYTKCRDLIDGGDAFRENIDNYLISRQTPKQASPQSDLENPFPAGDWGGVQSWATSETNSKKSWYRYIPHTAGILDQVASATSEDPVRVWTAEPSTYWMGIQDRMNWMTKPLMKAMLQYGKPCISINYPSLTQPTVLAAKKAGEKDAKMSMVLPDSIYDWEEDDDCDYVWAKVFTEDWVRSENYGLQDTLRTRVIYMTDKDIVTYEWSYKPESESPPNQNVMISPNVQEHFLGVTPLIPAYVPAANGYLWAGKRLLEPIESLLNSEACRRWWTIIQAHPLLLAPDPNNQPMVVPNRPDAAIKGLLEYISPAADGYESLKDICAEDYSALMSCLNAIARESIQSTQHARQSAKAMELDLEVSGHEGFAKGYAQGAKLAFQKWANAVSKDRKDPDASVEVQGLTDINGRTIEERTNTLILAGQIPGYPPIARNWETLKLALDTNPGLPKELKDKLISAFDLESDEVAKQQERNDARTDPASGEPAGAAPTE